jgi:hypothetical protein
MVEPLISQEVRRLTELLQDRLTAEQWEDVTVYLRVGEWGLALEMVADWLTEDGCPDRHPAARVHSRRTSAEAIRKTVCRST